MLRTCCASPSKQRFAKLIFSRHTFPTHHFGKKGGDMMEGPMHEIGVLMGGLACGAGFMIIALFITGIIH